MARAAACKVFENELVSAELTKVRGSQFTTAHPRAHEQCCDQEEYKTCCWPNPCAIDGKRDR